MRCIAGTRCNVGVTPGEAGQFIARVQFVREQRMRRMQFLQCRRDQAVKDRVSGRDAYRARHLLGRELGG